jgi:hypothetical protein
MRFGRKLRNIKRIGKKIGKRVNTIARKGLNTVEQVAGNPYVQLASNAFVPGAGVALEQLSEGAGNANDVRRDVVQFADGGNYKQAVRNALLANEN